MPQTTEVESHSDAFSPTATDLHLASCYYPALLELARDKKTLTYQQLLDLVKARYPDDESVQRMLCVRSGRILGVIYRFAEINGLPRITTLIVRGVGTGAARGECGSGVSSHLDCAAERQKCYAFDWSAKQPMFWDFIAASRSEASRVRPVRAVLSQTQAENVYWAYFLANRARLVAEARTAINALVGELRRGVPVASVFQPYVRP